MNDPARILVVDDTPMNVKLLEGVLTGHGFAVITAPAPVARIASTLRARSRSA